MNIDAPTEMQQQSDNVLKMDAQTNEEEISANGGLYPYDPTKADIDIREDPQTVYELVIRKFDQGKLILNPDFQRNLVWKDKQKSRFIESIILNFPLPPLYINKTNDGKFVIVDGLQRITSMREFLTNKFHLSELQALQNLNGKSFADLSPELQTKIEDKKLLLFVINPTTPLTVVYDIFNRINSNGSPLNRQEIRNCIYMGKATRLLKKLAGSQKFKDATKNGVSDQRMKAQEYVLRFLAFRIFDYNKDYKGDMSDFVENTMRKINKELDDKRIEELESDFLRAMRWSSEILGETAFRFPTEKTIGFVNVAVFETVCYFFASKSDAFLLKNKSATKSNYRKLIKDPDFINASRFSTGDKNRVSERFTIAQKMLAENTISV